jgi:hypothetical protein
MDDSNLRNQLRMANNLANLQHPASGSQQIFGLGGGPGPSDPYLPQNRISQQDLAVFKKRFPMLQEFSDSFLQSRTMDELLRIESTGQWRPLPGAVEAHHGTVNASQVHGSHPEAFKVIMELP